MMPGDVSRSIELPDMRDQWLEDLKTEGLRFFVLKAEDFLRALSEEEAFYFNQMLKKHEDYRTGKGKSSYNKYWVVNRDEPYAEEVRELIFKSEGVEN